MLFPVFTYLVIKIQNNNSAGAARISFGGTLEGVGLGGGGPGAKHPDDEEFRKLLKEFLKEIAKNALFKTIFQNILKAPR